LFHGGGHFVHPLLSNTGVVFLLISTVNQIVNKEASSKHWMQKADISATWQQWPITGLPA
jgi:hypothetical protein